VNPLAALGERLMVAAAGLDWLRSLLARTVEQLRLVNQPRLRPLEELSAIRDRLLGLQHLIETVHRRPR